MFAKSVYVERRRFLKEVIGKGLILFFGNDDSPCCSSTNQYWFIQDSDFLYYTGLKEANLALLIDIDHDREYLFGTEPSIGDKIWEGWIPSIRELADFSDIGYAGDYKLLSRILEEAFISGRTFHYPPFHRKDKFIKLSELIDRPYPEIKNNYSRTLVKAVISQRSVKSPEEVAEIEKALSVTGLMYREVRKIRRPGMSEVWLAGTLEGVRRSYGMDEPYQTILTVNGEILHTHPTEKKIKDGDMILIDAGARTSEGYCCDITRTIPAGNSLTPLQSDIYSLVLSAQLKAISLIKPGIKYRDVYIEASIVLTEGLKSLGFMKGNARDAVAAGAHALFFPHGLGHMLGMNPHDMSSYGEDNVGYDEDVKRSSQFGLCFLRLARELKPGFVLTVEPGIYFIPNLIDIWEREDKFRDFISYDYIRKNIDFTGIRIEDDVLVTADSCRVLGEPIPKML